MDQLKHSLVLQYFRRYDGTTEAERYFKQFESTQAEFKKDNSWAVQNLDRFLDGAASFWWQTNQRKYEDQIENKTKTADEVCKN